MLKTSSAYRLIVIPFSIFHSVMMQWSLEGAKPFMLVICSVETSRQFLFARWITSLLARSRKG